MTKTLICSIRPWGKPTFSDGSTIRYKDAYLPKDAPADGTPLAKVSDVAKFMAAHVEQGEAVYFGAKGMTSKPYKKNVPNRVIVGSHGYEFKGTTCDRVKIGHPDALAAVARIDAAIAELDRQKTELLAQRQLELEDAFHRGKKLTISDLTTDGEAKS